MTAAAKRKVATSSPKRVALASPPKLKIPKDLGQVADLAYNTKQERLAASRVIQEMQKIETTLKNHLIDNLSKRESATGIAGSIANAKIIKTPVAQIKDKDALWKWIKKGGIKRAHFIAPPAIDMAVIQDLLESGEALPPGVEVFNVVKVSLTKV